MPQPNPPSRFPIVHGVAKLLAIVSPCVNRQSGFLGIHFLKMI